MPHAPQQSGQLVPSRGLTSKVSRRLRQGPEQNSGQKHRRRSSDCIKSSPAQAGQNSSCCHASDHPAQGHANYGEGDSNGAPANGSKLGGESPGIRQRAAGAHAGDESENSKPHQAVSKGSRHGGGAENHYRADERGAAAETVSEVSRKRASHSHAGKANSQHRRKLGPREMPLSHDRWDRKT